MEVSFIVKLEAEVQIKHQQCHDELVGSEVNWKMNCVSEYFMNWILRYPFLEDNNALQSGRQPLHNQEAVPAPPANAASSKLLAHAYPRILLWGLQHDCDYK